MSESNNSRELQRLPDNYELEVSDPDETGLRLFKITSNETDVSAIFVEFNKNYDDHAAIPWAGARTSRSDNPHEKIYAEIKDTDSAKKLKRFFGDYGHLSIANMSPTMIHINNLPMYEAYWIFNHLTLVGGQETSTRYVELSNPTVTELGSLVNLEGLAAEKREHYENDWAEIQKLEHANFEKWFERVNERLLSFVRQTDPDLPDEKMEKRALDAARAWLPFGGKTSMSLQFDVREAINLITQLNERDDYYGRELADQLTTLYKLKDYEETQDIQADLAGLMKYTEGYDTVRPNTLSLKEYLQRVSGYDELVALSQQRIENNENPTEGTESSIEFIPADTYQAGDEVIAGYIATLLPNVKTAEIADFVNELSNYDRDNLLEVIFRDHTHHNIMRNAADIRGHIIDCETALAYLRDFNRHRALGRLAVMTETDNFDAVIKTGFNRSHVLSRTEALQRFEEEWNDDFVELYEKIYAFYDEIKRDLGESQDYSFMYHILPLGHQARLVMSGPLMQWNYFSHLRIRPGGDYGYREITDDIRKTIANRPGLRTSFAKQLESPNYNDPEELKDRS